MKNRINGDDEITLWDIIREVEASPIGGVMNCDVSEYTENTCVIHCWNGRRYRLTLETLEDGTEFDMDTGKPLP